MAEDTGAVESERTLDYREIDDVIHGRVRLTAMAYLSGAGTAEFAELRDRTKVTDGNLSVHLRKLEAAGYVEIAKNFVDRKPVTTCTMTDAGRDAWIAYIDGMRLMLFDEGVESKSG